MLATSVNNIQKSSTGSSLVGSPLQRARIDKEHRKSSCNNVG